MYCMHCGKELPEEAKFCFHCGQPVKTPEENPKKPETDAAKLRKWIIGGIALVGVIILVAVIVRKGKVIVPFGNDHIEDGDRVVIMACESGIRDLNEVIHR